MAETFWSIITKSKIEIPEIQRDYAQGRVNTRVNTIRKSFVSDLLDAANKGKSLNLDFVFGQSVDKTNQANFNQAKQSLEEMLKVLKKYSKDNGVDFESKVAPKPVVDGDDKLLIPFDGQQRLTTLFLIHLYIGIKAEKDITVLTKFIYKTRESSSQFIVKIIENSKVIFQFVPNNEIKLLSGAIKNESWFFSSWYKDPTVAGMLVMLDEIRKQANEKEVNFISAWANLTEKEAVCFDYFDIQEEGFDEDLYVKMNARGKGLTDFENFRAWLEKTHKHTLPKYDWVRKIDKDWLDLFWKTKKEVKDVDKNFLAFFKNMALLSKLGITNTKSDNLFSLERKSIELLSPKRFTSTSEYNKENVFNEISLDYIFKILEILTSDKDKELDTVVNQFWNETFRGTEKESFTKSILTRFDNLNLYHKTFFFSIIKFLELKGETNINNYTEEDWDNFKGWLRVSRNLIYNSRIDDSTAYIPAILAISNLDRDKILNINRTLYKISLDDEQSKWISFFTKEQQKEECEKVGFIMLNENSLKWQELIKKAENYSYFYGQIDFIFKLSDNNIVKFEEYLNKLILLFSNSNISSDEYILQCLFFAFDKTDTWLKSESRNRFKFYKSSRGNSRERDENWRIVFNNKDKRDVLKSLLDTNSCKLVDIQNLITSEKAKLGYDDWKYFILDDPKMLSYCGNALITKNDDKNIRLLEKTLNSSKQRELRTFHFFNKRKTFDKITFTPFEYFWYFTGERGNLNPCIAYSGWNYKGIDYYMDCFFDSGAFTLKFGRRTDGKLNEQIKTTLEHKHSFNLRPEEDNLYLSSITYSALENQLNLIIETLKEIK